MKLQSKLKRSDIQRQVLDLLPHLSRELYMDVSFDSINGFLDYPLCALFDYLGVPLVHGWLVDPEDKILTSALSTRSFLQWSMDLAVYLSLQETITVQKKRNDGHDKASMDAIAKFFLGPQLTVQGLMSLREKLNEKEPCVLLWSGSLITVTKVEGSIYILAVDPSLLTNTTAVWQLLEEVNKVGKFVDGNFSTAGLNLNITTLPLSKKDRKKEKKKQYNKRLLQMRLLQMTTTEVDQEISTSVGASTSHVELPIAPLPSSCSINNRTYDVRQFDFFGLRTHMIHQDNNGPCALIAICNALLLKGEISFETSIRAITENDLVGLLHESLEKTEIMQCSQSCSYSELQRRVLDVVPNLWNYTELNVFLNRIDGFEETPEVLLFDYLDIPLCHGWLADPNDYGAAVSSQSYYSLSDAVSNENLPNVDMARKFLQSAQFTDYGLRCLRNELKEMVPCVLFSYQHFSTIIKINGEIYSLATDLGYIETPVVWKRIDGLLGDETCMDHNFLPIVSGQGISTLLLGDETCMDHNFLPIVSGQGISTLDTSDTHLDKSILTVVASAEKNPQDTCDTHIEKGVLTVVASAEKNPQQNVVIPTTADPTTPYSVFKVGENEWSAPPNGIIGPYFGNLSRLKALKIHKQMNLSAQIRDFMSLEEFVKVAGNEFSVERRLFARGTSLTVVDTTKIGRIIAIEVLRQIITAHRAQCGWNGKLDIRNIYVIDGCHVLIFEKHCAKFNEQAMLNDFIAFVEQVLALFRIDGVYPAFFTQLARSLKEFSPNEMSYIDFVAFWEFIEAHLALKFSMTRAEFFCGLHRIRKSAPAHVKVALTTLLRGKILTDDWRDIIVTQGHPILKKVLRYSSDERHSGKKDKGSEKAKNEEETEFGVFTPSLESLSIFPRQVLEHPNDKPKRKDDEEKEPEELNEPFDGLSELDLLYSHYLDDYLIFVVEVISYNAYNVTPALDEWLQEVLELYNRPEVL